MGIIKRRLKQLAIMLPGVFIAWLAAYQTNAWAVDIADVPVVTSNASIPNIIFTFDDSGSMRRAYIPDGINGLQNTLRGCAPNINAMAYDPNVTYTVPPSDTGGTRTDTATLTSNFTQVPQNGFISGGTNIDLTSSTGYTPLWNASTSMTGVSSTTNCGGAGTNTTPYYVTYSTANFGIGACPAGGDENIDACYTKWSIAPTATAQLTNFANWIMYYRIRSNLAKSSAGLAFSGLADNSIRIAYQRVNSCTSLGGADATGTSHCKGNHVKKFAGTAAGTVRANFFRFLNQSPASGSTPARPAAQRAGAYLSNTNVYNPFAQDPGTSVGTEAACRQNYHVLFSDGYWNSSAGLSGNYDTPGSAYDLPLPNGTTTRNSWETYPAGGRAPYRDDTSVTNTDNLADAGFYYWSRDARPGLDNIVSPNISYTNADPTTEYWDYRNNPATWQHLVTYTVGLGIDGCFDYPAQLPNILAGSGISSNGTPNCPSSTHDGWLATATSQPENVDDMWHMAINSRGEYFSAKDPSSLVTSFQAVLNRIKDRSASVAPISTNSTQIFSGSRVYQASFNSGTWRGGLSSFTTSDGINFTLEWDTSASGSRFNNQTNLTRKIITWNTSVTPGANETYGVPFQWANINATQQNSLHDNPATVTVDNDGLGNSRLDYLRGDKSNEGTGNNFRLRSVTNMGDIVNSSPVVIGPTPLVFPDSLETVSHSSFRTFTQGRKRVIYFGANDGMFHGIDASFNAATNATGANAGEEVIAYVPSMLFPNLSKLTDPGYAHKFFVDATPASGDAFGAFPRCNGSDCWGSIIVSGLGAGGKGIFALDVTDPNLFSNETNANKVVLWEFTDSAAPNDMGLTFGTPIITRVRASGGAGHQWVAIFGNGYNSTSGKAVLYIVNIATGALVKKIEADTAGNNGLSSPTVVDEDGDYLFDVVYAGDLQGNVWKFNLRANNPSNWDVAMKSGGTNKPLFIASHNDGTTTTRQPITVKPLALKHPDGLGGFMVYFGTGKYMGTTDLSSTAVQTFYGIWDRNDYTGTGSETVSAASKVPQTAARTGSDSNLFRQTVDPTTETATGGEFRLTSNNGPIIWNTGTSTAPHYYGWYIDMPASEQLLSDPIVLDNKVLFISAVPNDDECGFGGDSFLMELDLRSGSRLASSPFDVNGDGVACGCLADLLGSGNVPSGTKIAGIVKGVAVLSGSGGGGGGGPRKIYYDPVTKKPKTVTNNEAGTKQRQSWKQIR